MSNMSEEGWESSLNRLCRRGLHKITMFYHKFKTDKVVDQEQLVEYMVDLMNLFDDVTPDLAKDVFERDFGRPIPSNYVDVFNKAIIKSNRPQLVEIKRYVKDKESGEMKEVVIEYYI
jgi:hypothetical protein